MATSAIPMAKQLSSKSNLRPTLQHAPHLLSSENLVHSIKNWSRHLVAFIKSIIHRDLKPENILIFYDTGNNVVYKLSDLGFAKDLSNSSNLCSTVVGTLQYLAPEIYLGKMYFKNFKKFKNVKYGQGLIQ
ncbi:Inhibitor of nuclear factor kappa-B kinase subunit alpha [Orchesella cincta]|uniref:IkappaB kinase n=1 Tax=Orchesella cincta TaxID=48709 RepID=A0A1D2NLQ2_ORCCI|nr:Inhibitor of nuclear factor kappa-B kinase subunit alpha [Orchesella cincta]